jgi:hypothetical protein
MVVRNVRVLGTAFFLVFVVSVGAAFAGTINLTSGTIDYTGISSGDGTVHLVGDREFTFDGGMPESLVGAGGQLFNPGDAISLEAFVSPDGVATLDGISYTDVNGLDSPTSMSLQMFGEVVAPAFGPSSTEKFVISVASFGTFTHPPAIGPPTGELFGETLVGNAIATVTLIQLLAPAGLRWYVSDLTYDIVAFLPVAIDIKSKTVKRQSHGRIRVTILSTETFDATTIDPETLRFGQTGSEQSLASCAKKGKDVNHDGLPDQQCSFETDATGFLYLGDTIGVMSGETLDNTSFKGSDSVQVR